MPEACQLAAELAELTGDSLRLAVVTALREERDRALDRRRRHDRIMAITREIARGSSMAATVTTDRLKIAISTMSV